MYTHVDMQMHRCSCNSKIIPEFPTDWEIVLLSENVLFQCRAFESLIKAQKHRPTGALNFQIQNLAMLPEADSHCQELRFKNLLVSDTCIIFAEKLLWKSGLP